MTRRMIAVAAGLSVLLAGLSNADLALAQCGSVNIQPWTNTYGSCDPGLPPTHGVSSSATWKVFGSTTCTGTPIAGQWYPYTTSNVAAGDLTTGTATGTCGCPPTASGPSSTQDGEHFDATVSYRSGCTTAGGSCQCVNYTAVSHAYGANACVSAACCSTDAGCTGGGNRWDATNCTCMDSPLMVDFAGGGLTLSSAEHGVTFDLRPGGPLERVAWPANTADVAFVVADLNGDGVINDGSELLGSQAQQAGPGERNGFNALAVYDTDGNGVVDSRDAEFQRLSLWFDVNRDGQTQKRELVPLIERGVRALSLRYQVLDETDAHGNIIAYRARAFAMPQRGALKALWFYDPFLQSRRAADPPQP